MSIENFSHDDTLTATTIREAVEDYEQQLEERTDHVADLKTDYYDASENCVSDDDAEAVQELREELVVVEDDLHDFTVEYEGTYRELKEALATLDDEGVEDLIHENYLKDYALNRAQDAGLDLNEWPANCIDWDEAADELGSDLSVIEFDGESYYYE